MKTLFKLIIAGALAATLSSCANLEGYKPKKMAKAIRAMESNNFNTRVFTYTGGRVNTFQ